MEINLPGIVNAATSVPNRDGRRAAIISDNRPNYRDPGFLSSDFPRNPPKLYVSAESDEFDQLTLSEWRDEGFEVEYLSMGEGEKQYRAKLASLNRSDLGPCETYAIVAYGDAASYCLEYFHVLDNNEDFKLSCLIAYYPTRIPDPETRFPGGVQVLVHLAGSEIGVVKQSQLVGIQGKRRTSRKAIERGIGTGRTLQLGYPGYTYDAEPGFAEHDLDEYDKVSAELAWSRSLAAARKAFQREPKAELLLEQNLQGKFYARDLNQTMSNYTTHKSPHVTYVPTLTGGVGAEELQRFYSQFFLDNGKPTEESLKLTLLSRTIGADRVVDELHVAFKHTAEMPWILPGVPPTGKRVKVVIVSIVTLRGGKLYHEHVYWDQASVLVQTGLLDPKLVPQKAKDRGVERLPVIGKDAARRMLGRDLNDEEEGEADNKLIKGWSNDHNSTDRNGDSAATDKNGDGETNGRKREEIENNGDKAE
ncbi:hypothetical protein SLS62_008633 [Diatrype stigma]|uniref:Dienelactone hydrolase n=1 Tax=Diatrype stigma TaxID=117547 RepID=A0AAN9YN19_9PEZI